MDAQKKTYDEQAKEFWDFARHVSEEVEEWPHWKRDALASFKASEVHSKSKQVRSIGEKVAGKSVEVRRRAETGRFVSGSKENTSAVGTHKKKK